jgi:hypothetical protein
MQDCIKSMNEDPQIEIVSNKALEKRKIVRHKSVISDNNVNYDSPVRNLTPQRSLMRQSTSNSRIICRNNEIFFQETEESIIELPIQLKISGKIKKK